MQLLSIKLFHMLIKGINAQFHKQPIEHFQPPHQLEKVHGRFLINFFDGLLPPQVAEQGNGFLFIVPSHRQQQLQPSF